MRARAQALFFNGKSAAVLLEAGAGALLVLLLVFSIVREIPVTNIPATFAFLLQAPVFWAAVRLSPAGDRTHKTPAFREIFFGLALRIVVLGLAWGLMAAFQAQALILSRFTQSGWNLVLYTACFVPFLLYRLTFYGISQWRRLTQKNLLWTLVNSHLLVVFVLVAIFTIFYRLINTSTAIDKFVPSGWVASLILELVRGVIPWIGVNLIFLLFLEAVFLPPAFLFSFLTSRRYVGRIRSLAEAMHRAKNGDLSTRVEPSGQDEVAQLQMDFNYMAAELQQEREKVEHLLQSQRELTTVVSHELRTPITVMRAYVENNLQEQADRLPEAVNHDLEIVHHEILSLQELVEDLFTLSQLDSQRLEMTCAWIDPGTTLGQVQGAYQPLAWKNKRIDLVCGEAENLPRVWADSRRLEQVLGNLIQNAIRHTPEGGVILVSSRAEDAGLEISVRDSGEGICAEDLEHIWERFYQGRNGGATGRTGIGLSLVKDLVEAMGGSVGVESLPGEGSRFWFCLRCETQSN
jgi:signal transduction histidine kinase